MILRIFSIPCVLGLLLTANSVIALPEKRNMPSPSIRQTSSATKFSSPFPSSLNSAVFPKQSTSLWQQHSLNVELSFSSIVHPSPPTSSQKKHPLGLTPLSDSTRSWLATTSRPTISPDSFSSRPIPYSSSAGSKNAPFPSSAPMPIPSNEISQISTIPTTPGSTQIFQTVSAGETITAWPGLIILGVGVGGFVDVDDVILPVAGGEEVAIGEVNVGRVLEPEEIILLPATLTSSTLASTSSSTPTPSSTATGTPTTYIVYAIDNPSAAQKSAINQELIQVAQPGSVREILAPGNYLLFYTASLTPIQASQLRQNPLIKSVHQDIPMRTDPNIPGNPPLDCPSNCKHTKRDDNIIFQANAAPELRMISQPPEVPLDAFSYYAYNSPAGIGITVYVVDSGANIDHPEWTGMPGSKRWLFAGGDHEMNDAKPDGHGSCMTSKISGPNFGVAKNANIVIVKLKVFEEEKHMFSDFIQGLAAIMVDVDENDLKGSAVVSISLVVSPSDLSQDFVEVLVYSFEQLEGLGVIIVCSSGNNVDELTPEIAMYPALLGPVFPIIIVGAVDLSGTRTWYSQGDEEDLTLSAPGEVICAEGTGNGYQRQTGTSPAAASVAGLVAYLMSLDPELYQSLGSSVSVYMKYVLRQFAYPRFFNGPMVLFNGVEAPHYCQASSSLALSTPQTKMACAASQNPSNPSAPRTSRTSQAFTASRTPQLHKL